MTSENEITPQTATDPLPQTMSALRAHHPGGPETLHLESAPVPHLGPDDALVRVAATAITFTELTWDQTWVDQRGADRAPVIPGHEVAGTIVAVGDAVDRDWLGRRVYGRTDFFRDGAAAQFQAVAIDDLAVRPDSVDAREAAATPLAALTAWQALRDHGRLREGDRLLLLGASGGVGLWVMQFAVRWGIRVVAVARDADADLVQALGAESVIRRGEDVGDLTAVDVILDAAGGAPLNDWVRFAKPGARLISLTAEPPAGLAGPESTSIFFIVRSDRDELDRITALIDSSGVHPTVANTYPLAEGRRAFEEGPTTHRPGKTVLDVDDRF